MSSEWQNDGGQSRQRIHVLLRKMMYASSVNGVINHAIACTELISIKCNWFKFRLFL